MLSFIGFDAAAALGGETRDPQRNIPRAAYGAMIWVGVFSVLMVNAETVGYGIDSIATDFANPNGIAPFDLISWRYSPWLPIFVDLVGVFSFYSASLAIINGSARILFTVPREGLMPRFLGALHLACHTPIGAIVVLFVLVFTAPPTAPTGTPNDSAAAIRLNAIPFIIGG